MAVGDAKRPVRAIRTTAGVVFPIAIAACIPFWTIKGTTVTGRTVLPILYGILIGSALIWVGATLWLRWQRDTALEAPPAAQPKRYGYIGREGSYGNLSDATFGDKLDVGIDSTGEVDASRARFGVPPEEQREGEE